MFKGMNRKVAISGMLGNGLEWYDYALYGHMSIVFSKLFFPMEDESLSMILTLLTFAIGFLARPLGAIFFGRIGDKYGRKKALTASMMLMAVPTAAIGLLPTYAQIGILAPILLLTVRLLQGFSLGGAYSGSMSYVVEHAPPQYRSTIGSLVKISLLIGFLCGSFASTVVASLMSEESFYSWGWRVPFILGIAIGFVGYWIRNHGEESPVYTKAKAAGKLSKTPVRDVFRDHPWKMVQGFSLYMFVTMPFYIVAIYMIAYMTRHLGLSEQDALLSNTIAMLFMLAAVYPSARLADVYGRRPVMIAAILTQLAITYPAFQWIQSGEFMRVLIVQCAFAFTTGWYLAPTPAVLVELFPTRIRYTGMSLSYNICAIIGGLTPAIAEWLIRATDEPTSIAWIYYGAGFVSFLMLYTYKDRWREPLPA